MRGRHITPAAAIVIGGLYTLLLAGCGQQPPAAVPAAGSEPAPPERTVVISAEDVKQLGIATAMVQRVTYTPRTDGYGVVVGLDAIAQMDSDLTNAEAAVRQSNAALERTRRLAATPGALPQSDIDTAERQASTDATQLALAQRKAAAQFGQNAPWHNVQERTAMLARFAAGREILVRATFPLGIVRGRAPAEIFVRRMDRAANASWTARTVWEAPADPAIPGRSFFALLEANDLSDGERVLVSAPQGVPVSGMLVPAEAVVLSEGQAWCYVVKAPGTFVRTRVDIGQPAPGGYFLSEGIEAGQSVVTAGTGLLLAREMNPSTEPGD